MPPCSSLRASDADREQIAERLRCAAGEGRLLAEELEQRLGAALRARTYGELDRVVADLPRTRTGEQRGAAFPLAGAAAVLAVAVLVLAAIAAAVLLITAAAAWGAWMLLAWWALGPRRCRHGAVRCARRRRGHAVPGPSRAPLSPFR